MHICAVSVGKLFNSNQFKSILLGNVRARVDPTTANSRDHLVHQLAPVETWGIEFITIPIPRAADRGDIFFITSSVPGTVVDITIKDRDSSVTATVEQRTLNGNGK